MWQLAQHVFAIWRARRQGRTRQLPLVIPVLLHHGRRPWTAPRSLQELLGGQELAAEVRAPLLVLQLAFRPLIVSMASWPEQAFRRLQMTVFGKLVCEALQRLPGAPLGEVLMVLRSWRELIAELASAPSAAESLQALWTYVLQTAEGRPEPVIEVVGELMEVGFMSKRRTAASYLLEEAVRKAVKKASGRAGSTCCEPSSTLASALRPAPSTGVWPQRAWQNSISGRCVC